LGVLLQRICRVFGLNFLHFIVQIIVSLDQGHSSNHSGVILNHS
jgi:hypothetical protein